MQPNKDEKQPKQEQQIQRVEVVREIAPSQQFGVDPLIIIEQRNKLLERVLAYAISATHAGQWVDQNGKPWPTAAAAEVMARRCAVSIKDTKCQKRQSQDDKGFFYIYEYVGTFSLPGAYDFIEAVGTCSSRDQFLGTETSEGRQLSEIDEGNIQKAAYSNMMVNGVTRLLGVRHLTYEQLAAAGIDQAKMPKVEYQSGSKGGGRKDLSAEAMKFGPGKGSALSDQTDANLKWYRDTFAADLKDPEKAKYKSRTEKLLAIADAEMTKRGAPTAAPEPGKKVTEKTGHKLNFGPHKGSDVADCPTEYLMELRPQVVKEVEKGNPKWRKANEDRLAAIDLALDARQ